MKTKDIKFTLGSGGRYKSSDASTITIEGFEVSSPRRDQEVHIEDFNIDKLASFLEAEDVSDNFDLNVLLQSLVSKHGIEKLMDELTNVCNIDEIQCELAKYED